MINKRASKQASDNMKKIDWNKSCKVLMAEICNDKMWLEYKKWLCMTPKQRQSYACEYSRKMKSLENQQASKQKG